jgi:hypothetical protein
LGDDDPLNDDDVLQGCLFVFCLVGSKGGEIRTLLKTLLPVAVVRVARRQMG